jgi:hypothetical protein
MPSRQPSSNPSSQPNLSPSSHPSGAPTRHPSKQPSSTPTVIPSSQPSSLPSLEETHNPKKLEDERIHTIEACIVRVMKARKTLAHGELVAQVMQQLNFFAPSAKVIKKRVEDLLEREYLARTADPNVYTYVA